MTRPPRGLTPRHDLARIRGRTRNLERRIIGPDTKAIRYEVAGQTGLWLYVETTDEHSGYGMWLNVLNADFRLEVEQTAWLIANALEIAIAENIAIAAGTEITLQAPSTQFSQGEVVVMLPNGSDFRVQDAGANTMLLVTGPIGSGKVSVWCDLDLKTKKIINLADPTSNQHAATKKYVDDTVGGGGGSPGGAAGGALDGFYPNPGIASSVAGAGLSESADVLAVNVDAASVLIASDTLKVGTVDGGTP